MTSTLLAMTDRQSIGFRMRRLTCENVHFRRFPIEGRMSIEIRSWDHERPAGRLTMLRSLELEAEHG
jgi:hypothetical protein